MKKILIIDDDDAMRLLLRFILKSRYEITIVNNGMQAYDFLSAGNVPSVIISDLNMPALSGGDFLKELRVSSMFKDIPVIILSADENPANIKKCNDLGVFKFIRKPFKPQELVKDIEEAILSTKVYS